MHRRAIICSGILYLLMVSFVTAEKLDPNAFDFSPNSERTTSSEYHRTDPSFLLELPITAVLEDMTVSERCNSSISLSLNPGASPDALYLSRKVETAWNKGAYADAIHLLTALEKIVDRGNIEIANTWRSPVPTAGERWGSDARVGLRDSIIVTGLDIHRESGHLFAVLLHRGDGIDYRWTVNFSDDNGASWVETFFVGSAGLITDVDIAVVDGYCYIAYTGGAASNQARVRRVNASDGSPALFTNDEQMVIIFQTEYPEIIENIAICSNQDVPEFQERLYLSALASDGEIQFYWDDERAINWTEISPGITDADCGLDMTFHDRFGSYWLWLSYFDTDNDLSIWRLDLSETWSPAFSTTVGSAEAEMTSIAAYDGTVICAYDCFSDHHGVRYHISYDEGSAWYWGIFDDTTIAQESPAVCAREGGGIAAAYRHDGDPAQIRFQWRDYNTAWGTVPQVVSDHDPHWNQPSIEYLGDGSYGVLYLIHSGPTVTGAYFDRGSCCILRGDVDHNGDGPDIGDLTYLVSFMFQAGLPIPCVEESNANGDDSRPDISDLIFIVEYMFQGGPPLVPCPGR